MQRTSLFIVLLKVLNYLVNFLFVNKLSGNSAWLFFRTARLGNILDWSVNFFFLHWLRIFFVVRLRSFFVGKFRNFCNDNLLGLRIIELLLLVDLYLFLFLILNNCFFICPRGLLFLKLGLNRFHVLSFVDLILFWHLRLLLFSWLSGDILCELNYWFLVISFWYSFNILWVHPYSLRLSHYQPVWTYWLLLMNFNLLFLLLFTILFHFLTNYLLCFILLLLWHLLKLKRFCFLFLKDVLCLHLFDVLDRLCCLLLLLDLYFFFLFLPLIPSIFPSFDLFLLFFLFLDFMGVLFNFTFRFILSLLRFLLLFRLYLFRWLGLWRNLLDWLGNYLNLLFAFFYYRFLYLLCLWLYSFSYLCFRIQMNRLVLLSLRDSRSFFLLLTLVLTFLSHLNLLMLLNRLRNIFLFFSLLLNRKVFAFHLYNLLYFSFWLSYLTGFFCLFFVLYLLFFHLVCKCTCLLRFFLYLICRLLLLLVYFLWLLELLLLWFLVFCLLLFAFFNLRVLTIMLSLICLLSFLFFTILDFFSSFNVSNLLSFLFLYFWRVSDFDLLMTDILFRFYIILSICHISVGHNTFSLRLWHIRCSLVGLLNSLIFLELFILFLDHEQLIKL